MYSSGTNLLIWALAAKSSGLNTGTGSSLSFCSKVNAPIAWHADAWGVITYALFDLNDPFNWRTADNSIVFNVKTTESGISPSSRSSIGLKITYSPSS